jgi:hypothetical protein
MSDQRTLEAEREALRARLERGYRESPRDALDEAERQELLARMKEIDRALNELQKRLEGPYDPTWKIALRVAGALAVWGGMVGLGARLGGLWGALGGLAAPIVLFLAYAMITYYGGKLLSGKGRPVGELLVGIDAEQRCARFHWTGEDPALPLGLLAHLDRKVWECGTRPPFGHHGLALLRAARAAAEARLQGGPAPANDWTACPGKPGDPSVSLVHDRLGIAYSTHHTVGGSGQSIAEERAGTLALLALGLARPEGERFASAVIDIVTRYEKGGENARGVIRKLAKVFPA